MYGTKKMLKVPLKLFLDRNKKSGHEMHINQHPHTYPENFRALALTVSAGEATGEKQKQKAFLFYCADYTIVV